MGRIKDLRQRNVRVRILTNSLSSTDAPIVHSAYKRYRTPLLDAGVELDAPTGVGVLGSVGQQVADDLRQAQWVRLETDVLRRQVDRGWIFLCARAGPERSFD